MLVLTMDLSNCVCIKVGDETIKLQLLCTTKINTARIGFAANKSVSIFRTDERVTAKHDDAQRDK